MSVPRSQGVVLPKRLQHQRPYPEWSEIAPPKSSPRRVPTQSEVEIGKVLVLGDFGPGLPDFLL